mmetsp:Transcript_17771/g.44996  ORF Transcript_17771/g.44996 Transcript_17771/m.44996 type:complete len:516 (+) Transcript_17771:114-1661(+)
MSTAMALPRGIELICKNGHPVTKFKKLKPWQGHVRDRACNSCGQPIDRKAFRWRCNEHCDWDICKVCYDRHWTAVIVKASRIQDPMRRAVLLNAVPEDKRPAPDDPMMSRYDSHEDEAKGGHSLEPQTPLSMAAQVGPVVLVWVIATLIGSWASSALLVGSDPLIPDPWLLSGVVHFGGALVCKLAAKVAGYDAATDQEAVEMTSASVLGVMFGLEYGLYTGVLRDPAAQGHHYVYMLRPVVMALAGVLAGTEAPQRSVVACAVLATLGGILVAHGGLDFEGMSQAFPWVALASGFTIFRWVFALNVLPRHGGLPSLLFFAGQMMWPCGAVGFEIAFLSDFTSYRTLLHLKHPGQAAMYFTIVIFAVSVQLAMELKLVQATSLTVFGLCAPLLNFAEVLRSLVLGGGIDRINCLGVVLLSVAAASYFLLQPKEPEGYAQLAAPMWRSEDSWRQPIQATASAPPGRPHMPMTAASQRSTISQPALHYAPPGASSRFSHNQDGRFGPPPHKKVGGRY